MSSQSLFQWLFNREWISKENKTEQYNPLLYKINAKHKTLEKKSNPELKEISVDLTKRYPEHKESEELIITAFALVAGSSVILTDPIFQGLAISLLFGAIASLIISPLAVPLLYYITHKKR